MSFYIILITFLNIFSYNLSSEVKTFKLSTPYFKNPEFSVSIEAPFQFSKEQRLKLASLSFSIPISDKNLFENRKNRLDADILMLQIENFLSETTKNLLINLENSRFLAKKYQILLFYIKKIEFYPN